MESGLPTKTLKDIQAIPQEAIDEGKYCIIWDKQGSVGTFMGYKMAYTDLAPDKMAVTLGKKTVGDVLDALRKRVVNAMLHGSILGIGVGNGAIDWNV